MINIWNITETNHKPRFLF